jgi:hypothetical protein
VKTRWKILVVLLLLVVAWIASEWTYPDRVRADLEETKRQLRQQGFRFELADFNSSTSPELRARASAIAPGVPFINKSVTWPLTDTPELMMPIGEHSAVVIWRQEKLTDYQLFN